MDFAIRAAKPADLDRIMHIYVHARKFMAAHGNPHQWGPTNWPPRDLVQDDIRTARSYVCEHAGRVVGVFFYDFGPDVEPTYAHIENGAWHHNGPYGVVHRIASDGSARGIGSHCIGWAMQKSGCLRMDTHGDNTVMQGLLRKLGFVERGIIYVEEDDYPRLAFEWPA